MVSGSNVACVTRVSIVASFSSMLDMVPCWFLTLDHRLLQSGSACHMYYMFTPCYAGLLLVVCLMATMLVGTTIFASIMIVSHSSNIVIIVLSCNHTGTIVIHCLLCILGPFLLVICWHLNYCYIWDVWHLVLVSYGHFKL